MLGLSTDVPTWRKPDPHPRQLWHLPGKSRVQALLTTARQDQDRLLMPELARLFTHRRREVPVRAP